MAVERLILDSRCPPRIGSFFSAGRVLARAVDSATNHPEIPSSWVAERLMTVGRRYLNPEELRITTGRLLAGEFGKIVAIKAYQKSLEVGIPIAFSCPTPQDENKFLNLLCWATEEQLLTMNDTRGLLPKWAIFPRPGRPDDVSSLYQSTFADPKGWPPAPYYFIWAGIASATLAEFLEKAGWNQTTTEEFQRLSGTQLTMAVVGVAAFPEYLSPAKLKMGLAAFLDNQKTQGKKSIAYQTLKGRETDFSPATIPIIAEMVIAVEPYIEKGRTRAEKAKSKDLHKPMDLAYERLEARRPDFYTNLRDFFPFLDDEDMELIDEAIEVSLPFRTKVRKDQKPPFPAL